MLYLPDETTPDKPYSIERIRPVHTLEAALSCTYDCLYGLYNTPDFNLHPRILDRILLWAWDQPSVDLLMPLDRFPDLVEALVTRKDEIKRKTDARRRLRWEEKERRLEAMADRRPNRFTFEYLLLSSRRDLTQRLRPIWEGHSVWGDIYSILEGWEKLFSSFHFTVGLSLTGDAQDGIWIRVSVDDPGIVAPHPWVMETLEVMRGRVRFIRYEILKAYPRELWWPPLGT